MRDRVGAPEFVGAWDAIANPAAVTGPVLVADWGGGWDGLDVAEVLAEQGLEVTLACAAPCPGGTLHQYQRNLYLARFDAREIAILHHTEVTAAGLRHLFSGRSSPLPQVATVVHAQGRAPEDELWADLEGTPGRVRAGDVLGPRSAEEATLEGVTALHAARAAVADGATSLRVPAPLRFRRPRRGPGGALLRPPLCASGRRASRGSVRRGRWRSSRPCRAGGRSRGWSLPRRPAPAPGARAA